MHPFLAGLASFALLVAFFWIGMHLLLAGRVPLSAADRACVVTSLFFLGLGAFSAAFLSDAVIANDKEYGPIGVVFIMMTWLLAAGVVFILGPGRRAWRLQERCRARRRQAAARVEQRRRDRSARPDARRSYPARVAARASRGRLEVAADDVLEAPETARILDQALAGSLPEKLAQSIVRHHVLERMAAQLAASGELDKLVNQALQSPQMRDALATVASSAGCSVRRFASSPESARLWPRTSSGRGSLGGAAAAVRRPDRPDRRPRPRMPALSPARSRSGSTPSSSSSSSPRGSGSSR